MNSFSKHKVGGMPGTPLVIDLAYGSMRPHEAAHQLAAQIGEELSSGQLRTRSRLFDGGEFIKTAEIGVDMEAKGRISIEAAWAHALTLSARISEVVYVQWPLHGRTCDDADRLFVLFLSELLPAGMVVEFDSAHWGEETSSSAKETELGFQGCLVPGILSESMRAAADIPQQNLIRLRRDSWMVPPSGRPDPNKVASSDWNWAVVVGASDPWKAAWAMLQADPEMTRKQLLVSLLEETYEEGFPHLALAYGSHLRQTATTAEERALWTIRMQGMRIGHLLFQEAAEEEVPEDFPDPLKGFLCLTVGWGKVMTAQAQEADRLFARARDLMKDLEDRPEYLYIQNISALAQVRLGHLDEAERIELDIERSLAGQADPTWSMQYINAINLHRLYRMRRDPRQAEIHLLRAEAANAGTRTRNDAIYLAHNLHRMAELKGDRAGSFAQLLACALLFVAHEVPESLASRTAAGLLAKPWPVRDAWTVSDLAESMRERIDRAAAGMGIDLETVELGATPHFVSADRLPSGHGVDGVVLGPIAILVCDVAIPNRRECAGSALTALRMTVAKVLAALNGGRWSWPTVVVEDCFGRGMPMSRDALIAQVLSFGGDRIHEQGRDHQVLSSDLHRLVVRIAPGVAQVTNSHVSFRRIYENFPLSPQLADLLQSIQGTPEGIAFSSFAPGEQRDIRNLEHQRVVVVDWPTSASEKPHTLDQMA